MNGLVTGFVGAIVEAWSELRVHRGRVLLSLIGVAVAVAALTVVVALGSIAQQTIVESSERSGGRAATMSMSIYAESGALDSARAREVFQESAERYDVTWTTQNSYLTAPVRFVDGSASVGVRLVDVDWAVMHREPVEVGSWFRAGDEARLAPALVVNQLFWDRIGRPDPATHPTVEFGGPDARTAVVVGVLPDPGYEEFEPSAFALASQATTQQLADAGGITLEMWVPEAESLALGDRVAADMRAALPGTQVDVYRSDFAQQNVQSLDQVRLIIAGIALLVLLLGALGLVNIALVTVRARIREIGIRRTFGATSGRVFFAVMMESVVATVVAGVAGVMLAILAVQNPWTQGLIAQGVQDIPPFPADAALAGLVAATAVGALAGLIPALVAVRVRVIDAIRY